MVLWMVTIFQPVGCKILLRQAGLAETHLIFPITVFVQRHFLFHFLRGGPAKGEVWQLVSFIKY